MVGLARCAALEGSRSCKCRSIAACFLLATTVARSSQLGGGAGGDRACHHPDSRHQLPGSGSGRRFIGFGFAGSATMKLEGLSMPLAAAEAKSTRGLSRMLYVGTGCATSHGLGASGIEGFVGEGRWRAAGRQHRGLGTSQRAAKVAGVGAGAGLGEGATRVTVLVGGEERIVDDKAMRDAVQESADDSLVTVHIQVQKSLGTKRLDALLSEEISILSRSSLSRIIKAEGVTINGKTPKPSTKLKAGDEIYVSLPPPPSTDVEGEDIPLDVLYEDSQVILVNKQSDLVVHPAPTAPSGTLVNALVHHFKNVGGARGLSSVGSDRARPGIVHRLDRNTTGVMVIAKTEGAHWHLYEQFARRATDKRYLALVHGTVSPAKGLIDQPLGRHPRDPTKFAVQTDGSGKSSQTEYIVRESYQGFSLVELKLLTGRTHQIRVHMAHLKHPLVGDNTYGGKPLIVSDVVRPQELSRNPSFSGTQPLITRQALHSCTLRFSHPETEDYRTILAPAPPDFCKAISFLREHRLLEVMDAAKFGSKIPMDDIIVPV